MGVEFDGGAVETVGLEFVSKSFDHGEDLGQIDFQMKEQAVGVFAVTEGLVGGESGRSQQRGTAREIKDIAVPVESCKGTRFPCKEQIFSCEISECNAMPTDLLLSAWMDIRTERGSKELTAEADAENGLRAFQCILDQDHFIANQGNLSCS